MTNYVTPGVTAFIAQIKALSGQEHADWAAVFADVYEDTLQNALQPDGSERIFVLTGDIPAMWQRDSTAQIRPYLIPAQQDPALAEIIAQVIRRQLFNMQLDPYANAFNRTASGAGHADDETQMTPWIWERKYELDSLCYPAQLTYLFWKNTGRTDLFDETFIKAIDKMVTVIRQEQDHAHSPYRFERHNGVLSDTLENGVGSPFAVTGMSWSGFRPSDDTCTYGYLVSANLFASATLRQLAQVFREVLRKPERALVLEQLADELHAGVMQQGLMTNAAGEAILAYEVDGLGHAILMDDANVPSLLSLPYLGAIAADDPLYQATRRTILSTENPFFYQGQYASGIGSPHTPRRYVWPIALAMAGLTQSDQDSKAVILDQLVATTAETGHMHEGFDVDDPTRFTRPWFSWANMMFCELVMDYFGLQVKQ